MSPAEGMLLLGLAIAGTLFWTVVSILRELYVLFPIPSTGSDDDEGGYVLRRPGIAITLTGRPE